MRTPHSGSTQTPYVLKLAAWELIRAYVHSKMKAWREVSWSFVRLPSLSCRFLACSTGVDWAQVRGVLLGTSSMHRWRVQAEGEGEEGKRNRGCCYYLSRAKKGGR